MPLVTFPVDGVIVVDPLRDYPVLVPPACLCEATPT